MGYRVEYGPMDRAFRSRRPSLRLSLLSGLFLLLFALAVRFCWPEGRETVQALLFPGDWHETEAALEAFAQQLTEGGSLADCAESFCREIIAGAGIGIG